jgi:3-dehydroquinate synthase II
MIFADPKSLTKTKIQTIFPSQNANYVILDKAKTKKSKGKKIGRRFEVLSNKDIENILDSAKKGLDFVVIEVKDWKIIPLENIIAKLHKNDRRGDKKSPYYQWDFAT